MRRVLISFLAMSLCVVALSAMWIVRADDVLKFKAKFSGFEEVGSLNAETGAILSPGTATLNLTLDKAAQTVTYTLTYSFPSTTSVLQSHIHFGKIHVPGNIMVFLCTNKGNGPSGVAVPACPTFEGTVTGTITAAAVEAIPSQNILTAGDFDALVSALTSHTAYANIHTSAFQAGEIRGQVEPERPPHGRFGFGGFPGPGGFSR